MASAVTTCFTHPPTPRPPLTFKGSSLNLPIAPPKIYRPFQTAVFPRSFSAMVREPRVLVPVARSLGGCALKNNELPSDLTKGGGRRSLYKYWRQQAIQSENENQGHENISDEKLYKVMKILVSVLSFLSVDGDPNKGISEERCESILQYMPYSDCANDHLPEEYAPHLARLLNKYSDILATQQRIREPDLQDFRGKVLSALGDCFFGPESFLWPVAAFLALSLFYSLLFSAFVIYRCATISVTELEVCLHSFLALFFHRFKLGNVYIIPTQM